MASQIDPTLPVAGMPTTESVRSNFAHAKAEIEALQAVESAPLAHFHTKAHVTDFDEAAYVHASGDESVAGVKTFDAFPELPDAAPVDDRQAVPKDYVDGELAGKADAVHNHTKAFVTDFAEGDYVHTTGDETVGGLKTFSEFPVLPASDPGASSRYAVHKGYVDAEYQRRTHVEAGAPGVDDGAVSGRRVGDFWLDSGTGSLYVCTDATVGAAVWRQLAFAA